MDTWLGVELRHLAALAAVQEAGSVRGAAKRLGYVQSAVSQQISSLEEAVGAQLVERKQGQPGMQLTESGCVLLAHADRILSQLDAAQADLRSLQDGNRETVNVGLYQGLAKGLLPRALTLLAERAPGLHMETREELSDANLFGAVEQGLIDLAFAELPLDAGPFESRSLFVDPLVLLVPANSDLAGRSTPPDLSAIAEQPLIFDPTWRMFELVTAEFGVAGLKLEKSFTAHTSSGAQALVAAGLGVTIMPRLAADPTDPTVEAIALDHLLPVQTVVCFWHRGRQFGESLEIVLDVLTTAGQQLAAATRADGAVSPTRVRQPQREAAGPGGGSPRRKRATQPR